MPNEMQIEMRKTAPRSLNAGSLICVLVALLTLVIAGCSMFHRGDPKAGTYEGPATTIGQGNARAFVTLDAAGRPTTIGIEMSEAALTGLPAEPPPGEEGWEYVLTLPAKAAVTGYNHVAINWNPKGHVPPGVYDVPHFDFHFYLISVDARNKITAVGDDLARVDKVPPEEFMPDRYILPPGTEVARMGGHAVDPSSDEFNNKPFTKTFIYGFYDGHLIFVEPMITRAYLESNPSVTAAVKLPKAYEQHAYYPTLYSVNYDSARGLYTIALEGLAPR